MNQAVPHSWRQESAKLLSLAAPILIGQWAQIGMGVTDTIMAGRYAAQDLAAIAIGQSIWLPVYMFFIGLFAATTTLVARFNGAGDIRAIRHISQQSLWLALFGSPLAIYLLLQASYVYAAIGLEEVIAQITDHYLFYLSFGMPAAIGFLPLRGFSEGMKLTRPIMLVNIFALACNIPLNYLLIYGVTDFSVWPGMPHFSLAPMGGAGCGLATALVMWLQLLALLVLCRRIGTLRKINIFSYWQKPLWTYIKSVLGLGLPIGVATVAEISMFSVIALLLVPLGGDVIAGHQVALSVSSIVFMVPLSFGMALTIQTGQYLGSQKLPQARFVSLLGLIIATQIALLMMLAILLGRTGIVALYSNDAAIQPIAVSLMLFMAIYQIPDAIQICATAALRAYCDTRVPLVIILISYWVLSVPLGWCLTYGFSYSGVSIGAMGARGMWLGLVCGLSCAALLQVSRLAIVLARHRQA
jgi:MATE family multidrug resistance protein